MKNYDKNSLTGFVLMFLILLIFNFYFLPTTEETQQNNEEIKTAQVLFGLILGKSFLPFIMLPNT